MKLRVNRDIAALLQEVRTSVNGRERGEQQDTISWDELKDLYMQSGYASRGIRLKTICQGSSIEPDKTVSLGSVGGQKKSPELVKHLEQLQRRLDQKLYDDMVKDVTVGERRAREQEGVSFRGYTEQMRFGAHVVSMMAVFFMFGYMASYRLFESESHRILCGIVLMFCGMVMETVLLCLKENKVHHSASSLEKKKKKDKTRMNIPTTGKQHQA